MLCAGLPTLMMGPDPGDVQSDGEEEVEETDPDYVPGPYCYCYYFYFHDDYCSS